MEGEAVLDAAGLQARAEAGIGRDAFTQTDLTALVTDIADLFEPLADDRGLAIAVTPSAPVVTMRRPSAV